MTQAALRVKNHLAAQTTVHHHPYALYGERGLGNGRGQHHLALTRPAWGDGSPLLGLRQNAIKGQDVRLAQLTA